MFSGDYNFTVIKTMRCTYDEAWKIANETANKLGGIIDHYDIMGDFESETEMQKDIIVRTNKDIKSFRMSKVYDLCLA
jgi:hypothetical protein